MLNTLYEKTFFILGTQLGLTWLVTVTVLGIIRHQYRAQASWIAGDVNKDGNLDLDLDWQVVAPYFFALVIADIVVFLILGLYGQFHLHVGVPLFYIWSFITGIVLALCLVLIDENLGGKILALTALITCIAGLIGAKSGVDFSFLRTVLTLALEILFFAYLIRTLFTIQLWIQRFWAFFGILTFTGFLIYNFNKLSQLSQNVSANTWSEAMRISIRIYLEIINLFLYLLDFLNLMH